MKLGLADKVAWITAIALADDLPRAAIRVAVVLLFIIHTTRSDELTFTASHARIAQSARLDTKTVKRALRALVDFGFISLAAGLHRSRPTTITILERGTSSPPFDKPKGGQTRPEKGGKVIPKGGQSRSLTLYPMDNTRGLNTHGGRLSVEQELSSVLDAEHVRAIIEHRRALKKPLTRRAARLLAARLAACPDPNAAADEMVLRGWISINPDWLDNRRRGSDPVGTFARHKTL